MIAEEITNVKDFMTKLLVSDTFDHFLTTDISITTYNTFHIDGHIQKDFYDNDEYSDIGAPLLSNWGTLKSLCYQIIKGHKVPLKFKIIFMMPSDIVSKIIEENEINISPEQITGLFLNIKFEQGKLSYVTGTSLSIFDLSKDTERAFDSYISNFVSTLF